MTINPYAKRTWTPEFAKERFSDWVADLEPAAGRLHAVLEAERPGLVDRLESGDLEALSTLKRWAFEKASIGDVPKAVEQPGEPPYPTRKPGVSWFEHSLSALVARLLLSAFDGAELMMDVGKDSAYRYLPLVWAYGRADSPVMMAAFMLPGREGTVSPVADLYMSGSGLFLILRRHLDAGHELTPRLAIMFMKPEARGDSKRDGRITPPEDLEIMDPHGMRKAAEQLRDHYLIEDAEVAQDGSSIDFTVVSRRKIDPSFGYMAVVQRVLWDASDPDLHG